MGLPAGKALAVLTIGSVLLAGCGGGGSGGGGGGSTPCDDFDCQGMVNNLAANVMQPTFDEFESAAMALEGAVSTYQGDPTPANKEAAQDAWKQAMAVWQRAELMQLGPLLDNSSQLRDTIYSWPAISSCDVDQDVINAEDQDYDITTQTPKRRGLDALGYILFTEDLDHTCPGGITITQTWNARDDADREQTRADYAELAAEDLANQASSLVLRWSEFREELAQPGTSSSRFDNVEEAVNAISDALFYLEKQTNDTKLAEPPGFKANSCGGEGTVCPDDVESPFARVSRENIIENMEGFRQLFLGREPGGTDGLGFSEFLAAQSNEGENVAQTMINDLDGAQTTLEGVTMSLFDAVQDDSARSELQVAFDELSEVNKQLKDQFLRILGLTIPDAAAGDGD